MACVLVFVDGQTGRRHLFLLREHADGATQDLGPADDSGLLLERAQQRGPRRKSGAGSWWTSASATTRSIPLLRSSQIFKRRMSSVSRSLRAW